MGTLGGVADGRGVGGLYSAAQARPGAQFGEERPSQAIIVLPVLVVGLAMVSTAQHYAISRDVTRLLQQGVRLRLRTRMPKPWNDFRTPLGARRMTSAPHADRRGLSARATV